MRGAKKRQAKKGPSDVEIPGTATAPFQGKAATRECRPWLVGYSDFNNDVLRCGAESREISGARGIRDPAQTEKPSP